MQKMELEVKQAKVVVALWHGQQDFFAK